MTAALAIGVLRAAMDDSIKYAKERKAFGKAIGKYQLIQAKIADMATDLEASRLLTYKATGLIDKKVDALKEATMAKYFATEAACRTSDEATRIFGGYGFSMEYPVQRYYRDNRMLLSGGGTHEILRTNIARWAGV
jgi:alkylation response protein AidB-like acyl-CoA dehydrogenase